MGGFGNTAEGYETMMLKDQFFTTCSKELRTFLKEKGKQNLKEMLKCAENYLDAHAEEQHNKGGAKPKQNRQLVSYWFLNGTSAQKGHQCQAYGKYVKIYNAIKTYTYIYALQKYSRYKLQKM